MSIDLTAEDEQATIEALNTEYARQDHPEDFVDRDEPVAAGSFLATRPCKTRCGQQNASAVPCSAGGARPQHRNEMIRKPPFAVLPTPPADERPDIRERLTGCSGGRESDRMMDRLIGWPNCRRFCARIMDKPAVRASSRPRVTQYSSPLMETCGAPVMHRKPPH